MKNLVSFLLILGVLMSSCQGPRHNFNKQKFTKLKHLKSEDEQQFNNEDLNDREEFVSYDQHLIEESVPHILEKESTFDFNPKQDGLDISSPKEKDESITDQGIEIQRNFHNYSNERRGSEMDPGNLSGILIVLGFLALIAQAIIAIPVSTSILWPLGIFLFFLMLVTLASFISAFLLKRKARKSKAEENGDRDGVEDKDYQDARDYFNLAMFSRAIVTLCFIMAISLELFFSFGLIVAIAAILGLVVLAGLIFNVWSNMNAAVSMAKHVKSGATLTRKAKAIRFFLWLELVYVGLPMLFIPLIISLIKVSKIRKGKA